MSDTAMASNVGGRGLDALGGAGANREFETPEQTLEWTHVLGERLLACLHDLAEREHGLRAATISTADGLNVCSLGVDAAAVAQLAALVSSLHSLANASARTVLGDGLDEADSVVVTIGDTQILATTIGEPAEAPLVLLVATSGTTLGVLLHHARQTAEHIRRRLGDD